MKNRLFGVAFLVSLIAVDVYATSYVRQSSDAESRFRQGFEDVFPGEPFDEWRSAMESQFMSPFLLGQQTFRWQNEGMIWQSGVDAAPQTVFEQGDEITIVSDLFDYSRSSISIDFQLLGNQPLLSGQVTPPPVRSMENHYLKDISRELVFPVGSLAPGTYELIISRAVSVYDYDDDCPSGFYDSSCFELTGGFDQHAEDRIIFTVVPEPQSMQLILLGSALLFCRSSRWKRS